MAMTRRWSVPALILAAFVAAGFGGCPDSTDPAGSGAGVDGVIHYAPIEGGCWTLTVPPSHVYQPIDLPAAFQHDGMAVRVAFKERPDMGSICMVGPLVQILSISAR
jgi:hypothetical protein